MSLALQAQDLLAAAGVRTRVVSLPCWEAFEAQDRSYRESVLPANVTVRVSIEAGATFGWSRYIGDGGAYVGLDRYGASAPGPVAMKELGFTPENVVRTVRELLGR